MIVYDHNKYDKVEFVYKGVKQTFVWIPPGKFMMGSPLGEAERFDDEKQHEVIITKGFWLADTACTQALWTAVMGSNPSRFKGDNRPVENVSWDDVKKFIDQLNNEIQGLNLRLPTEAEWEFACRSGTTGPFSFGENIDPTRVNYDGNYPYKGGMKGEFRGETVPVKSLPANSWGLYEMHGNVWEWCEDWYGEYPSDPVNDPKDTKKGEDRVLRGGCWIDVGGDVRSAYRVRDDPDFRYGSIGFRLAKDQDGHSFGSF